MLNDQHACADSYESYMVEWNDDYANRYNYHQWTSSGLSIIQESSLLSQFEYLADTADDYESGDADGEIDKEVSVRLPGKHNLRVLRRFIPSLITGHSMTLLMLNVLFTEIS